MVRDSKSKTRDYKDYYMKGEQFYKCNNCMGRYKELDEVQELITDGTRSWYGNHVIYRWVEFLHFTVTFATVSPAYTIDGVGASPADANWWVQQ